jgi:hypothetical protein
MAIDLIHDSKAAASDLTDRPPGGAASTALGYSAGDELPSAIAQGDAGSGLTGGDSANPQTSLTSSLGSEDGAGAPSYHSGLARPVTVSFLPPPANAPGSDTGPGLAFSPPSVTELFTGGFGDATPPSGGGTIDFSSKGGNGGGPGGSGGGGTPTPYTAHNAFGLTFNINWDSSVSTAPSGFVGGVQTAVQYFLNTFGSNSPTTITINVGWGEVAGQRLFFGALGESQTNIYQYQYSSLYSAMASEANAPNGTQDQRNAVASLGSSTTSPISNAHYWVSSANARELGLGLPAGATSPDGWIGFGKVSWYFGTGTQSSGQYDFVSTAEHEISEVMGRIALLGASVNDGGTVIPNGFGNLDLFRFSSAGTRSLTGGQAAYLSFDGGTTALKSFNTTAGGDWGDWQSSSTSDAYDAFASSGHLDPVSAIDGRELNVLGYTLTSPIV